MQTVKFSADGIRGIIGHWPLTAEGAKRFGASFGKLIRKQFPTLLSPTVMVGRDTRPSGASLTKHLVEGILDIGVDVLNLEVITTPGLSYLSHHSHACGAVMVSASHNPSEYNGFKFLNTKGLRLTQEDELEAIFNKSQLRTDTEVERGTQKRGVQELVELYISHQTTLFKNNNLTTLKDLKLVVDCANGATAMVVPETLRRSGAEVATINRGGSEAIINDSCGSEYVRSHPESFAETIRRCSADYGLAFDGDGDRLVIVDRCGHLFDGDDFLFILADYFLRKLKSGKPIVVTTEMANRGLELALNQLDITVHRTAHGDKNLERELWTNGYLLGSEPVGNVILNDGHHSGADPLYAALLILGITRSTECSIAQLVENFHKNPQSIITVTVPEDAIMQDILSLKNETARILRLLGKKARILPWISSTEKGALKILVEGTSDNSSEEVQQAANILREAITLSLN